jgi:hypothetical protein
LQAVDFRLLSGFCGLFWHDQSRRSVGNFSPFAPKVSLTVKLLASSLRPRGPLSSKSPFRNAGGGALLLGRIEGKE